MPQAIPLVAMAVVTAAATKYSVDAATRAQNVQTEAQEQQMATARTAQQKQNEALAKQQTAANVQGEEADARRRAAAAAGELPVDQASETLLTGTAGIQNSLLGFGKTAKR